MNNGKTSSEGLRSLEIHGDARQGANVGGHLGARECSCPMVLRLHAAISRVVAIIYTRIWGLLGYDNGAESRSVWRNGRYPEEYLCQCKSFTIIISG
jgi:hypothetical protein